MYQVYFINKFVVHAFVYYGSNGDNFSKCVLFKQHESYMALFTQVIKKTQVDVSSDKPGGHAKMHKKIV